MKETIAQIKKIFEETNRDTIRYKDIEHIIKHHEALKRMQEKNLVDVYCHGYKLYIVKNW